MSAPDLIRESAVYHDHILSAIAELDYIPSAVSQQVAYVKDLEAQLQRNVDNLENLRAVTEKERKEHEDIRDSTMRRLGHKLVGKKEAFKEKELKEEREFLDALEQEMMEKNSQEMLLQMLNEAKEIEAGLLAKSVQYEAHKEELHNLYSRIFDGPTPELQGEDKLEYEFRTSRVLHERIQKELNAECQSAQLLTKADQIMTTCLVKMDEALGYNTWDLWGGGGYSEYMQSSTLSAAQSLARQAEVLFRQAQGLCPQVAPVGEFIVPFEGFFLSNVIFDNVYTDLKFRERIKQMISNLAGVHSRLKAERDASNRRANVAGTQLIEAAKELEESRNALHTFRRETFRALGSSSSNTGGDPTTQPAIGGPFSAPDHPPPAPLQPSDEDNRSIPPMPAISPPSYPPPNYSPPPSSQRNAQDSSNTRAAKALAQGSFSPPDHPPPTPSQTQTPSHPPHWGNKNPYAAALSLEAQPQL